MDDGTDINVLGGLYGQCKKIRLRKADKNEQPCSVDTQNTKGEQTERKKSMNYICINGQKIELTEEQTERIERAVMDQYRCSDETAGSAAENKIQLAQVPVGEVVNVGGYELVVLEQLEDSTAMICKELIGEPSAFGENNNYDGSYVDEICNSFSEAIEDAVGEENLLPHVVDLTSDDGLKDYGTVIRRVSLLTTELYRRYVEILDKFKPDRWWWLATPYSTPKHEDSSWIKCVTPSGRVGRGYYSGGGGVRPFFLFESSIFESSGAEE